MVRFLKMFLGVTIIIVFFSSCSKSSEQKAYDEVIAAMSAEKAKQFFKNYPQSKFRDRLVDEIMGWCKQDETVGCYKMILDAIPKEHPMHKEVSAYYEKHFEGKK